MELYMPTVGGARAWALEELKRARIDSPALTADLLLGFVLGCDRVCLLSHPEQAMDEGSWGRFRLLTQRRAGGEPLQYLTGEQEFYGLAFKVTPAVLIPRPETEILVEKAIQLIRRHAAPDIRFADVGTGSGCIAVSVAHQISDSIGWALDISADALKIAQQNAKRHGVDHRIRFVQSDLFECFPKKPCFDFIFCNPPYVALGECDSLPTEVKNHEPHKALFGGASGLEVYRRLIPEASDRLAAEGYFLLEVGVGQAQQVGQLMEKEKLLAQPALKDLRGIPRCLIGQKISREK
jgi:release factor glutamine methyltransferase